MHHYYHFLSISLRSCTSAHYGYGRPLLTHLSWASSGNAAGRCICDRMPTTRPTRTSLKRSRTTTNRAVRDARPASSTSSWRACSWSRTSIPWTPRRPSRTRYAIASDAWGKIEMLHLHQHTQSDTKYYRTFLTFLVASFDVNSSTSFSQTPLLKKNLKMTNLHPWI